MPDRVKILTDGLEIDVDPGDTSLGFDDEEGPDEETTQGIVQRLLDEAVDHHRDVIEPDLVKATDYYWARPLGNEVAKRSQVVAPIVRDITLGQIPSIMRIVFSRKRPAEFRPRLVPGADPATVQGDLLRARHMTEHVAQAVETQGGFREVYSSLKDGLVRRVGVFKWWWEEEDTEFSESFTGLNDEELQVLVSDPAVTDWDMDNVYDVPGVDPQTGESVMVPAYDVTLVVTKTQGREKFAAVPPEEIVWTPEARDIDSAQILAHVREVSVSELVEMGYDKELAMKHAGAPRGRARDNETMDYARQAYMGSSVVERGVTSEEQDESQRTVIFAEAFTRVDTDGDGIGELRMFHCLGEDRVIVNGDGLGERVDEINLAVWTPEIEPHAIAGMSNYDLVGSIQRVMTDIERAQLDSLSQSVTNDTEVVMGEVNMGDVLKRERNKVIRVRKPGMMREVSHRFVGGDTLPILDYYTSRGEEATGQSKASRGLEAGALQSSTAAAVTGTFSRSQERIEIVARSFVETGLLPLYRGLARLAVKHRSGPHTLFIRGAPTDVDPSSWDLDADLEVNVGNGQGTPEQEIAFLEGILAKQEEYMAQGVPFVDFTHIRATIDEIVMVSGRRSSSSYFAAWGPEEQQAFMQQQQQQAQQAPPDPSVALIELEKQKAEADNTVAQIKLQLEAQKLAMEDDRKRDEMASTAVLKERELEMKFQTDIRDAELRAQVDAARAAQGDTGGQTA